VRDCGIAELGYTHTSLAKIGRRAGVSKGVVSYHFASKELLEQLLIDVYTAGGAAIAARIGQETSPAAAHGSGREGRGEV
jgi:AcrR family transcriptional regulator